MRRIQASRLKREREEALDIGLRLDFTEEAPSLKRVHVDHAKAKILAVDDEAIVLDSFRKILVLAGYCLDTVENGQEALGLVQKNDYDFVFTDLKMPEMDGLDVTKAVKHFRPDIDVIIITGYATIESAVDAMKYGAMDYVQKPFTEDELVDFVNKTLIRRQDRIEKQIRPKIHLVRDASGKSPSEHVFNVPAGIFISPQHTWLNIEMTGTVRIGIDDFARKTIGAIAEITLPALGKKVQKGDSLFAIKQNEHVLTFPAPISGRVTSVNTELTEHLDLLKVKPYELGWICCIEALNLTEDLKDLRIGADAVSWYREEIDKFSETMRQISREKQQEGTSDDTERKEQISHNVWDAFDTSFLRV
jgi:CheY-like chemotaxis protein